MNGTFNTKLTAPFDCFQHSIYRKGIRAMNVFTIGNSDEAFTTVEGIGILPDFNFKKDSLPKIDFLVVQVQFIIWIRIWKMKRSLILFKKLIKMHNL